MGVPGESYLGETGFLLVESFNILLGCAKVVKTYVDTYRCMKSILSTVKRHQINLVSCEKAKLQMYNKIRSETNK